MLIEVKIASVKHNKNRQCELRLVKSMEAGLTSDLASDVPILYMFINMPEGLDRVEGIVLLTILVRQALLFLCCFVDEKLWFWWPLEFFDLISASMQAHVGSVEILLLSGSNAPARF